MTRRWGSWLRWGNWLRLRRGMPQGELLPPLLRYDPSEWHDNTSPGTGKIIKDGQIMYQITKEENTDGCCFFGIYENQIVAIMGITPGTLICMMTSSNGNIFLVTGSLCGEFTGHRWIPLTKAIDAELWCFLWFFAWINGWVNNREAGDLRRPCAHYDVIVMACQITEIHL